jgi:uncharacterized protein
MPTSKTLLSAIAAGLLAVSLPGTPAGAADAQRFGSIAAALRDGMAAYKRGDYKVALPALEFAAAENELSAQYTLAELYADNAGSETDHAKAYMFFQSIADEHSDADPDDTRRAPYVAKSLTALAGYLRVGMPEIGLKPDPQRAADYLHHAALFFGDEDAQFELVKLKLVGEGIPADIASAKHWLAVLTQRGHAGAQAFLADLLWRGKFMPADKVSAFALISVAVEHAPPRERIWIEDVYQNIFCGAGDGIRKQATGMVADWRSRYGRRAEASQRQGLDPLYPLTVRTCQNGEKVLTFETVKDQVAKAAPPAAPATTGALPALGLSSQPASDGASAPGPSLGLRDVGTSVSTGLPAPGLAQGFVQAPGPSPR